MQHVDVLQQDPPLHFLPVVISDGGSPSLSSTNTLTITVCDCDLQGTHRRCTQEVLLLPEGLSSISTTGLACLVTLSGMMMTRRGPAQTQTEFDIRTEAEPRWCSLDCSGCQWLFLQNVIYLSCHCCHGNAVLSPQVLSW